jgi:hypothetical protein
VATPKNFVTVICVIAPALTLVIVGVHESNNDSNNNLYYRIGHLVIGDDHPRIEWASCRFGLRYDSGENPHIALNNHNEIVVVHQVANLVATPNDHVSQ